MPRVQAFIFLVLSILIGGICAAAAQTLSYADAVDQLAVACRADLAKYCKALSSVTDVSGLPRCDQPGCRRNANRLA